MAEVCNLRWEWEIQIPELDTSVFVIPGGKVKNREDRLVVLNSVAKDVVEKMRGSHEKFVFSYRGQQIKTMDGTAWKNARKKLNLQQIRIHDLKHTYGRRLRAAGVDIETRKDLLGHKSGKITAHYSAPELENLIQASEKVCGTLSRKTHAIVILRPKQFAKNSG